jgi:uncharacterized protein (TIGR03435 family)
MRLTISAFSLLCVASSASAQLHFEVATVKPSSPLTQMDEMHMKVMRRVRPTGLINSPDPGRVRIEKQPMLDILAAAYNMRVEQVTAPGWAADAPFDIEATVPTKTESDPPNHLNLMLQTLLKERFGLVAHIEERTLSGYALVVAKGGPKFQDATPPEPNLTKEDLMERNRKMMAQRGKDHKPGANWSSYNNISMADFAGNLTSTIGGPVTDQTNLTGKYALSIETWADTPEEPGFTIFQAVEKLGLKLEPRKVPVPTLVVETLAKLPTEN